MLHMHYVCIDFASGKIISRCKEALVSIFTEGIRFFLQ